MIIPRTFTPHRWAILGLKAEATRAIPYMVREKKYQRRTMETTAAPMTATLWDCMLELPIVKISCEKKPWMTRGYFPQMISARFLKMMEKEMKEHTIITMLAPFLRSGLMASASIRMATREMVRSESRAHDKGELEHDRSV
jgi:Mg/Co/Ni transporter MgtE